MANERFTPGPWTYKRTHELSNDTWYVIIDPNGRGPIVDVGGKGESIAVASHLVTDHDEIEANASLIAAAPAMYEALNKIVSWSAHLPQLANEDLAFAREAIQLANPETPKP